MGLSEDAHGGDLRLGTLSTSNCRAKNYHFAGVPRKNVVVKMNMWTRTPPWTQRMEIFVRFYPQILRIVLRDLFV